MNKKTDTGQTIMMLKNYVIYGSINNVETLILGIILLNVSK